MRLKDKDGDEADRFFYADGPNLVEISVSDETKSCMRSFTDGEETMSSFMKVWGDMMFWTQIKKKVSNGGSVTLISRFFAGTAGQTIVCR
jgi:hypothetical protein